MRTVSGIAGALVVLTSVAMAGEYVVGPGDVLQVQVYEEAELSGEVVVSEGCTVSLALIGAVEVCGLSTDAIAAKVGASLAAGYLIEPKVAVRVLDHRSQRVDVLGEVQKRGPIYLQGPTTIVEVVSLAGGPLAENVFEVQVIGADGASRLYDLLALTGSPEEVLAHPGDKIILRPGKVVYVEGQIKKPGTVTVRDGLTVTQALALAGGPDEFANLRRVLVRRADGSQVRVSVPRVHKGKEPDPVLGPDDHVIVPRNAY